MKRKKMKNNIRQIKLREDSVSETYKDGSADEVSLKTKRGDTVILSFEQVHELAELLGYKMNTKK